MDESKKRHLFTCFIGALVLSTALAVQCALLVAARHYLTPLPENPPEQSAARPITVPADDPPPITHPLRLPAVLLRVVDGDTIDLRVRTWEDTTKTLRIRLLGVDTPELHPRKGSETEKEAEKARAASAKAFTEKALTHTPYILLETTTKTDSFGRPLGDLLYQGDSGHTVNLTHQLLSNGHADPWK